MTLGPEQAPTQPAAGHRPVGPTHPKVCITFPAAPPFLSCKTDNAGQRPCYQRHIT